MGIMTKSLISGERQTKTLSSFHHFYGGKVLFSHQFLEMKTTRRTALEQTRLHPRFGCLDTDRRISQTASSVSNEQK